MDWKKISEDLINDECPPSKDGHKCTICNCEECWKAWWEENKDKD